MSAPWNIEPEYLTLEEFIARPEREDGLREELLDGELVVSPGHKAWHADIVLHVRAALASLEASGDYVIANNFACLLRPRSMPVPGLAVVRRERWDEAVRDDTWLENAPELVVEVASPSNRRLLKKAGIWLEYGAEQVWIVFPERRTVSILDPDGLREVRGNEVLEFRGVRVPSSDIL